MMTTPIINKIARSLRETWFFWVFFFCLGLRSGREAEMSQMSPRAELLASLAFSLLVALWWGADARRREREMGYGFPALVFLLWPIFAPVYLFQTRGARAFLSLLAFGALFLVTGWIGALIGAATVR